MALRSFSSGENDCVEQLSLSILVVIYWEEKFSTSSAVVEEKLVHMFYVLETLTNYSGESTISKQQYYVGERLKILVETQRDFLHQC